MYGYKVVKLGLYVGNYSTSITSSSPISMKVVLLSVETFLDTDILNIIKRIFNSTITRNITPAIFQIFLLRLFLIAICSLIFASCSAMTSLSSSSGIVPQAIQINIIVALLLY